MSKQPELELNERFYIFDNFITSNKHILERGDEEWDSSKIFFQLSIEHADNSPLTIDAEKFEEDGKVDWSYLRNVNRDKALFLNAQKNRLILENIGIGLCKPYDEEYLFIYDSEYNQEALLVVKIEDLTIQNEICLECESEIVNFEILNNKIVFLDRDGILGIVDIDDSKVVLKVENVLDFYMISNDKKILIQNNELDLEIYDLQSLEKEKSFSGHYDKIQNIIEDEDFLITWTAQSPEDEDDFFMSEDYDDNEEFDENDIDYTEGKDVSVRIWDKKTHSELKVFNKFDDFIRGVKKINNYLVVYTSYQLYKINLDKMKLSLVDEFELICNVEVIEDTIVLTDENTINFYNKKIKYINKIKLDYSMNIYSLIKKINNNLVISLENGKNCVIDFETLKIVKFFGETKATSEEILELKNGDIAIKDINDTLIIYDKDNFNAKTIDNRQTHFNYFETKYGIVIYGAFTGVVLLDTQKENFSTFNKDKVLAAIFNVFKKQNYIIYTSLDGELVIYDLEKHKYIYHKRIFNDMFYTKEIGETSLLMWENEGNELYIFSLKTFEFVDSKEVYSEDASIEDVIVTNEYFIVIPSATNDKFYSIIYDETLNKIKKLKLDNNFGEIEEVIYKEDKLFLGYEFGLIEIWDIKKLKLKRSKEIGLFSNFNICYNFIYILDKEGDIHMFDQKLKEINFIEFSKYCIYEDSNININSFGEYTVISNEDITLLLNYNNEIIKEISKYTFYKIINDSLVLKYHDKYLVYDINIQEKLRLDISDKLKDKTDVLYDLRLINKIDDRYIYNRSNGSNGLFFTDKNEKYFYDGFISTVFENNNEIIFELKGQIKSLSLFIENNLKSKKNKK